MCYNILKCDHGKIGFIIEQISKNYGAVSYAFATELALPIYQIYEQVLVQFVNDSVIFELVGCFNYVI